MTREPPPLRRVKSPRPRSITRTVFRLPLWVRALGVVSLVLSAGLVLVSVFTATSSERQHTRETADRSLLSTAQAERQALENYFARARSIVLLTAQNPALRELYSGRVRTRARVLDDVNDALSYLERLYPDSIGEACLIDRGGVERARVVRGVRAEGDELSHEEGDNAFFASTFAMRAGQVHQARPYLSPDTREWVISNSTPVPLPGRAPRAIAHFEVTIESFRRAAAAVNKRAVTRIVDPQTRRVVLDSRFPQRPGTALGQPADPALLDAISKAAVGGEGTLATVGGRRTAIRALPRSAGNANRWFVVVTNGAADSASAWRPRAGTLLLLTAGLAFFAVALATLRAYARILQRAALTDGLTGLPNRALLLDRTQQAIHQARRSGRHVAALMLDLDRFKEINDTLGHHQGDVLLKEVAARLRCAVREGDTVARLGGDEFAVLAAELADPLLAVQLAERIDRALTGCVMLGGVEVDVTSSIGIALSPEHGADVDALLQRADVAMYEAKRSHQPHCLYAAELDPYTAERLALVAELRRAIEDHALHLHYQPKYDLQTRRPCGVEALVRWEHPQRGPIAPGEFVPIAENTGLIRPLTELVLDQALSQVREWRDAGHSLPVSVNLSARSLLDDELPTRIAATLASHEVPSELLCLEITESVIMEDPSRALAILRRLDRMGLRLAIDDFGTGYSSLAYLKQLPVAELKIDRSFVMNMAASEEDAAIVRSTVELGHNLGLDVVAEGVEDEPTLEELARLTCETAQGYFLAYPQPAAQITELLAGTPVVPSCLDGCV